VHVDVMPSATSYDGRLVLPRGGVAGTKPGLYWKLHPRDGCAIRWIRSGDLDGECLYARRVIDPAAIRPESARGSLSLPLSLSLSLSLSLYFERGKGRKETDKGKRKVDT